MVRDAAAETTIRSFVRGMKTGVGSLMVMMLLKTLPVWKACVKDEDCFHSPLCVQKRARGRGPDITAVNLAVATALREYQERRKKKEKEKRKDRLEGSCIVLFVIATITSQV